MGESKRRREFFSQHPQHRLGDAPVEAAYHDKMIELTKLIDMYWNGDKRGPDREVGFVLMVFPFGDRDGRCNYMSNGADRKDVISLMREMIARFEGQPDPKPGRA